MEVTEKPGVQELYLAIMEQASFNNFDGEQVAGYLRDHRDLWKSALMAEDRDGSCLTLRDLPSGYVNLDTLYIYPASMEAAAQLHDVAESEWGCDEVDVLSESQSSELLGSRPAPARILRVWWD